MDTIQVRGHSALSRAPGISFRVLAAIFDLTVGLVLFLLLIGFTGLSPIPKLWWWVAWGVGSVALWAAQVFFLGNSVGERIWQIEIAPAPIAGPLATEESRSALKRDLREPESRSPAELLTGTFLTALVAVFAYATADFGILRHPLYTTATQEELTPFMPGAPAANSGDANAVTWAVTPFFYSLGAWPKTFQGSPVFHSLPYEKGPPTRFVGHITARWKMPDVRMTFEGPKTPSTAQALGLREYLKERLLTSSWLRASPGCLNAKEQTLGRHLEEMNAVRPDRWAMRWVTVVNPALAKNEQLQGIYITAARDFPNAPQQDRFIALTAQGTHQAFILDYRLNDGGTLARRTFEQALRSLRISNDLLPGRAWVDRSLESVNLALIQAQSQKSKNEGLFLYRLSEIQQMLLSKLSVDAATFDTYFHLAGTSALLYRNAPKSQTSALAEDWSAVARPMIDSVYRYAQDVSPGSPKLQQIQRIWLETKK